MINKTYPDIHTALTDIHDGATIMVGGFGGMGTPFNLIDELRNKGVRGLTLICNAYQNILRLDKEQVKKVIMSFPMATISSMMLNPFEERMLSGEIEVEIVPQGTLAERIRVGGAGIPAFYTPTGVGTVVEKGKEKRRFGNRDCLLELALTADFSLIKAYKADIKGNLIYRKAMRNFNAIMGMAGRVTIAEVEDILDAGALDSEVIVTPGIYVDRLVKVKPQVAFFKTRQARRVEAARLRNQK